MARRYAGILGLAAFAAAAMRSAIHGAAPEQAFLFAVAAMFVFAAIGAIVGRIAQATVEQSVQQRFAAEMKSAAAGDSRQRGA